MVDDLKSFTSSRMSENKHTRSSTIIIHKHYKGSNSAALLGGHKFGDVNLARPEISEEWYLTAFYTHTGSVRTSFYASVTGENVILDWKIDV